MATAHRFRKLTEEEFLSSSGSNPKEGCFSRLLKEVRYLDDCLDDILSVFLDAESNDYKHWEAMIKGPVDTPYENGVFALDIRIPVKYPFEPPEIKFKTKIYHPNISSKGEICLDILHTQWPASHTVQKAVLCIVSLLSDPNTDDFLEPEAAFLYQKDRTEYNRKAEEWTRTYAAAVGVPREAQQEDLNGVHHPTDAIMEMNISSDQIEQEEVVSMQSTEERRPGRFSVFEPLKAKAFDNGESKNHVPIVEECLRPRKDRLVRHRYQMSSDHTITERLDINSELQLLAVELGEVGNELEKRSESMILIESLFKLIGLSSDEVCQGCLRIYSMETFLYSELNQFLCEGDHSKIEIYGPFVRLLCFCFEHPSLVEVHSITVYRGANLSLTMINIYKEAAKNSVSYRWSGFSSTSKSQEFAENFHTNTVFIMQLKKIYSREKKAIDISHYSELPEEEEILLRTGVEFTVENVNYDDEKKKHYINLNVYV
ncbi:unnamed protein product [Adineta steineri]|uniref:NAD(P)(+)--arginine ADP-ribosyltransferase n=1 Tax=Adineta steineri TaxID=433720 RepID=A0A815GPH3_9BILA|nr:unnamed protein product [Adineta steineri]CAF1592969.1 unnamed protein product [Adineta steineri]